MKVGGRTGVQHVHTVVPKDQISVGVPHRKHNMASGDLNMGAPICSASSPILM